MVQLIDEVFPAKDSHTPEKIATDFGSQDPWKLV
jgi:hypothetical protein